MQACTYVYMHACVHQNTYYSAFIVTHRNEAFLGLIISYISNRAYNKLDYDCMYGTYLIRHQCSFESFSTQSEFKNNS